MLTRRFQSFLCIPALLGTVHAVDCTARAWVRAPDLIPDTIVQGDARVKISAGCPAVDTVLLGLRLKERSFVKISPRGPEKEMTGMTLRCAELLDETGLDSWMVREEERLVFATTWAIDVPEASQDRDVVQDFAVLVPYTNFPPALDYANHQFTSGDRATVNTNFQYEYFIRVPFANGTTTEIPAGTTGFQPLFDAENTPRGSSSEIVGLKRLHFGAPLKDSVTTYTAEVSSVSDLSFNEGSNLVTVVITRTGPARTFTEPLRVRGCVEQYVSSKWAVDYDLTSVQMLHSFVLRSTLEDVEDPEQNLMIPSSSCFGPTGLVSLTMPNATAEEIKSRSVVTTRSVPVSLPIEVNRRHIPDFDMYYQIFTNSLQITLGTPRTEYEAVDPDNPSAEDPSFLHILGFTDDEEPWVPWEETPTFEMPRPETWGTYIGKVPAVVHPVGQVTPSRSCIPPGTGVSYQVTLQDEHSCQQRSLLHYLDEDARGPAFVDPSAVHELLAEDPVERELLAPLLAPVVSSPPKGEELGHRYHLRPNFHTPLIYVGETWTKKVVKKREHDVASVH